MRQYRDAEVIYETDGLGRPSRLTEEAFAAREGLSVEALRADFASLSICCKDDALDDKPCAMNARELRRLAAMALREAERLEREAAMPARRADRKGG